MEVTSGDMAEAASPGDVPMDTAANSPEGIAMSLFQDQDMEVTAPSPQIQPLVPQGDGQHDTLEQIMNSIQVVEAPNQQQQPLQSQPAPQQQVQQPQQISQDNVLKFGQDINMGGITLNCGTMDNNQAVQNILGQLLNPVTQQPQNGTHHLIQAADGSLQLINMNGSILQNLPTASTNITLTTDTNSGPVTTPFVLQQANPPGTTQPVLLNPNTFLLNPGATVSPQTIILNPFTVPNQPNPAAANNTTIFVAPANLASGNATTFLTNLNAAQLQPTVDANVGGGNNAATVLLTTPANVSGGDSNTILLQPETKTNVPVPPASVGAPVGASIPMEVKPFNSGLRRSLGKSSSQKTVQELLMEDEQKRVQVDSKALDLVKTRDTLALRLKLRRPRNELVDQGIIPSTAFKSSPAFHEQLQKLERAKVGDHLQKKMRMRPDKAQLVHHHILEDTNLDPIVNARQQMLKRARLEQDLDIKIKNRPGPLELIEGNILKPETEVEQLVKDGSLRFFKTSASDPESLFTFYDTTDGSDEALSPPQPDTSTSDTQPSSVTSIPSPSESLFLNDKVKPFANAQTSPNKIISSTVPSLTIKQEQGVTSPPAAGHSPFSVLSGSSSCKNSSSSRSQRKKQAKRSKPKEIKFHEYKPPNEQGSKAGNQAPLGNPYNLLLMQQQLYLQLQLLQQQQQQRALPAEQPNLATSSSSSTTVVTPSTKLPSPTVQQQQQTMASASASPSQSDVKSTATNSSTNSSSNSSSNTTSSTSSTANTTATSTTATRTFSLANIEDMKVSELKAELKNRGLHVSGTKPQLVQRLRNAELTAQSGSLANSPDVTSSSATKVTSSTDVHIDSLSDCNSNRQSLTSPPVSPPDMKGTEPMSPSSPQFESPTFQPMKTTSISSPVSNASSVSFQSLPQSQEQRKVEEMTMSPPASVGSLQLKSPPPSVASTIGDGTTASMEMVDLTDYCARDAKTSSQLLKQQQQKIEELQRALELSQMQLIQQQFASNRVYNPPPPPPPPPPPAMNSGMANRVHTSGQSSEFQQFFPDLKLSSPPNPKTSSFQGQDFAHTINQQPKIFSFASPPANGQPFQFTKSHSDLRAVHSSNGIITPKSASMPSSPTEEAILELGSGLARSITNPNFMAPPPNYEEAVRQTTERKAQMMGSPPPAQPMTSVPNTSRSSVSPSNLSFDDLLEVLVGHGYPATSSGIQKDSRQVVQNTPPMKSPPPPPVTAAFSNNTTSATAIQRSLPDLTASPGPMEVDHSDLSIFNHVVSDNKSKNRYSIPSMQIDSTDPDNSLLSLTLESGSPAENAFPGALSADNDLNWLDLVLPSTSASTSGHSTVGGNPESSVTGSFVKDPFPLNLSELTDINSSSEFHHLDGDMWDNIQVTE